MELVEVSVLCFIYFLLHNDVCVFAIDLFATDFSFVQVRLLPQQHRSQIQLIIKRR